VIFIHEGRDSDIFYINLLTKPSDDDEEHIYFHSVCLYGLFNPVAGDEAIAGNFYGSRVFSSP
jgi:hypothetical protein